MCRSELNKRMSKGLHGRIRQAERAVSGTFVRDRTGLSMKSLAHHPK